MLLAPFLAELVSGSTAPQAWLLPPVPLVFMAVYGVGALVIREFALRVRGGPATVLVLGLAFGVVNEGMAAHSLFNPGWPSLGVLGTYGRWEGVNWLWTEWIVPFHAVWSISFPIFVVGELWPGSRSTRFLSDRWLVGLAPVPVLVAVVTGEIFAGYPLSAADWLGMGVAVALIVLVAWRWGPRIGRWRLRSSWRPTPGVGVAAVAAFFVAGQIGTWQTPKLSPYPEVGFVCLLLLFVFLGLIAESFQGNPEGECTAFAGVLTGVAFFTLLSPISEFVLGRIALVPIDVSVWLALYVLYRRRCRELSQGPARERSSPSG